MFPDSICIFQFDYQAYTGFFKQFQVHGKIETVAGNRLNWTPHLRESGIMLAYEILKS